MIESISFKTRARTVDHLGREQIADCPTAISELWKNAYDAYSRKVSLDIYQDDTPIAALVDDGHGMNKEEFIQKWLVIGTESKATGEAAADDDRKGLLPRPRQGQKGIGRLSAAALGPLLLFVSKRSMSSFVLALIDWRLFENPFLLLDDVQIPVLEIEHKEDILKNIPVMFDQLLENIIGTGPDERRNERISDAWEKYDAIETREGLPSTRLSIENIIITTAFSDRHFEQWPVWNGKSDSGTALLVSDISFDLYAQLNSSATSSLEQPEQQAKERLFETLSNFTDPFSDADDVDSGFSVSDFEYSVTAWHGALPTTIVSSDRSFDYENLEDLEHILEGRFDESGIFRGKAKVFGKWLDEPVLIPPKTLGGVRSDTRVGSFRIRIGTFEVLLSNTSHSEEVWSKLTAQAEKYSGFMVYRDGLRVMPYGREDNDFFEIEKRRSNHAGREFWSYRRVFGRVAIARAHNPNLKDKAGREGIIDNKAAKIFRDLVENLLMTSARRYFGTDSKIRQAVLPEIQLGRQQQKAEEAQKNIRSRQRKEFRQKLNRFIPIMDVMCNELELIAEQAKVNSLPDNEEGLIKLREALLEIQSTRSDLTFGSVPKTLGSLSSDYKSFRKKAVYASDLISQLNSSVILSLEKIRPRSPRDIAYSELSRHANSIQQRLRRWNIEAKKLLAEESERLGNLIDERSKLYHSTCLPYLEPLTEGATSLSTTLNQLEVEREALDSENEEIFTAYISSLQSLRDSVNVEAMVSFSLDRYEEATKEISRLNALAQLGITVEIIGHEIEGLELSITEALRSSPPDFKCTPNYKTISQSHEELIDRLRFLSPLKLSGEKIRTWISGKEIFEYSSMFLRKTLEASGVKLVASQDFLRFSVFEQQERIFPVFINIINNAIYWSSQQRSDPPEILLDVVDGEVLIADNGPGVEADDIDRLFTLFFTTKIRGGRGVGLYLCRANLAVGGHSVFYVTDKSKCKLPGANFLINFKGVKYD